MFWKITNLLRQSLFLLIALIVYLIRSKILVTQIYFELF